MALKLRHRKWSAKIAIPTDVRHHFGGRSHIERSLQTSDRREADVLHAKLDADFKASVHHLRTGKTVELEPRTLYAEERQRAASGTYRAYGYAAGSPEEQGIELEIDRLAEAHADPDTELSAAVEARLRALQDAQSELRGNSVAVPEEYSPTFSEAAKAHLENWGREARRKDSNTKQQKQAIFDLWTRYSADKQLAAIRQRDVTRFVDALRRLDPNWARTPASRNLPWAALQGRFGDHARGLSQSSINRHMGNLAAVWDWGKAREHCSGANPFMGHRTKVKRGLNADTYMPWEDDELIVLLSAPPKRRDLHELMLVAMFSGLRINEAAAMTWGELREDDGIHYFNVTEAKTNAGNRQVPVHTALSWLTKRGRGPKEARIWQGFNPEGHGRKPGNDASRAFSDYKQRRGFKDRSKTFHSFRKNVTRIIEREGVHHSQWAQILGHERGFTFETYNPQGLRLSDKAKLVELLQYPGVPPELLQPPQGAL